MEDTQKRSLLSFSISQTMNFLALHIGTKAFITITYSATHPITTIETLISFLKVNDKRQKIQKIHLFDQALPETTKYN